MKWISDTVHITQIMCHQVGDQLLASTLKYFLQEDLSQAWCSRSSNGTPVMALILSIHFAAGHPTLSYHFTQNHFGNFIMKVTKSQ